MLLLPVGHEETVVRRLPWVTITIAVLCTLLQLRACSIAPEVEREHAAISRSIAEVTDRALTKEEMSRTRAKGVDGFVELATEKLDNLAQPLQGSQRHAARVRAFRDGELLPKDDPLYVRYLGLQADLDETLSRHPVVQLGYQPAGDGLLSMLTSLFAHGGWLHLLGNLWFLYLVGCNLEDRWGRGFYAAFYLLGGIFAAVSYAAMHPDSEMRLVGASGAVSAAMGGFLVCYATTKIRFNYFYFFFRRIEFSAPAWLMLPLWALEQALMMSFESVTGVAHSAHVGGFAYGLGVALLLRTTGLDEGMNEEIETLVGDGDVWTEDPQYLAALDALEQGRDDVALAGLLDALRAHPERPEIHERIFEVGLRQKDAAAVAPSASWLLRRARNAGDHVGVATIFRRLHMDVPHHVLTAQELSWVAEAARREPDAATVVRAAGMMLQRHGDSPLLPRAMWLAAEMQEHHGKRELVRDTLGRLIARFPRDPFATQARARLAELDGGAGLP